MTAQIRPEEPDASREFRKSTLSALIRFEVALLAKITKKNGRNLLNISKMKDGSTVGLCCLYYLSDSKSIVYTESSYMGKIVVNVYNQNKAAAQTTLEDIFKEWTFS